jgi:hypothetical protein
VAIVFNVLFMSCLLSFEYLELSRIFLRGFDGRQLSGDVDLTGIEESVVAETVILVNVTGGAGQHEVKYAWTKNLRGRLST